MYEELKKYKTNKKITVQCDFPEQTEINTYIDLDEYRAGVGDLIEDFIIHKNKPFWKRKYYHNHLTKSYKKMLNRFIVTVGL